MTIFERLKFLANKQGKSINRVEQDLNLPKNSLYSWKKAVPSGDRLELIADYFHVSVDYLLGRDTTEPQLPDLTVDQILDSVENYSGGELTESDREMLRIIIEAKKASIHKEQNK